MDELQVLIVTHNRLKYLKNCIASMRSNNYPFVLNVWDNCSSDGTKEWLREEEFNNGIFFDCNKNFGTAIARNSGLSAINSKWILMSDDDMFYNPDCFKYSVDAINYLEEEYGNFAILCLYNPFEKVRYKKNMYEGVIRKGKLSIHIVKSLPPGSWLLNKEVVLGVGGFKLPKNKLMGFSSWHMPERIRDYGFNIAYLSNYGKNSNIGSIHMDNREYVDNFVDYYEKTGYNEFRRRQKGKK